jgi:hypothetical protein
MGLADFIAQAMGRKKADIAARANRAGPAGVQAARAVVPVRTGKLRDSIGFTYDQSTMTLSLYADASYAYEVNRRAHFMEAGLAAMRRIFTGGTTDIQFATLDEKYHDKAREATKGRGIIIGHRKRVKFKR